MKKVYKIKRICHDPYPNVKPYEDSPEEAFISYNDAWDFIEKLAEEEVDGLNECCIEGVSFGIPMDERYSSKEKCVVNYYYMKDNDETGNTEVVTEYSIYMLESDIEYYNAKLRKKYGQSIVTRIEKCDDGDDEIYYYFAPCRFDEDNESAWYSSIEEAYNAADEYLDSF